MQSLSIIGITNAITLTVKVAIVVLLSKLQIRICYVQEAAPVSKLSNVFYVNLIKVSWLFLSIGCVGYMVHVCVYVMFWIAFKLNLLYYRCILQTYSYHHCEIEKDNFVLFCTQAVEELMTWIELFQVNVQIVMTWIGF